jgi:hypothetical protein
MTAPRGLSRRPFLWGLRDAPFVPAFLSSFHDLAAADKPGLGIELNPDVVRAHLAPGETWWG